MKFVFTELSWEDYLFWQKNDRQKQKRINEVLKDISRNPYEEIGKPEPLKFNYAGFWSRRIDEEHRLIYRIVDDEIQIVKCRFHYDQKIIKLHLSSIREAKKKALEKVGAFFCLRSWSVTCRQDYSSASRTLGIRNQEINNNTGDVS